ncbi:MAG: ATP-binding protein [Acidobacteriota bacterium]
MAVRADLVPRRVRWLTFGAAAAVVLVNLGGAWSIVVARRGILEEASRALAARTQARARLMETVLSQSHDDLGFLQASPAFAAVDASRSSDAGREAADAALLMFLRSHPEVIRLGVGGTDGTLAEVSRRGGVPVLWRPATPAAGSEGTAAARPALGVDAGIDPEALLARGAEMAGPSCACTLLDARGSALARDERAIGTDVLSSEAPVDATSWSSGASWRLRCEEPRAALAGMLEPVAGRYRLTLFLNLGMMALALGLGSFGLQQAWRRERIERSADEERRIRELERQLFHSERLRTVGRLAAGMAHEINNPLEGMANYLALCDGALSKGDAARAAEHLGKARQGLHLAAGIVRQVLRHAEAAQAPQDVLDVNELMRQSSSFVASQKTFPEIAFPLDLAPDLPPVQGSEVSLGQVFLNLIINACEAQPDGGEVRLRSEKNDGEVLLTIADRGPGIAPEDAARVFEPFFSTKRSPGLGLSVCHAIVAQHGGKLWVEPRPGGGALFSIRLPARAAA